MIKQDNSSAQQFQDNLHAVLTWFLSPKSKGIELLDDGLHSLRILAENISSNYRNIPANDSKRKIQPLVIPEIVEQEYLNKDAAYLSALTDLAKFAKDNLSGYLTAFLVHGSMATLDYSKGWSDLDTYLIIKREVIFDPLRLLELRQKLLSAHTYLLRIDPLQHHGFLVCSDLDVQQYACYYLPVEALKFAKSIFGDCQLEFSVLENTIGLKERFQRHVQFFKRTYEEGVLKHHAYQGEYLLDNFGNRHNAMYQMKNFLEFIAILPAYYREAKGIPCYKRDSFAPTRPDVPGENWELIEKASFIRREWERRESHPYQGNSVPHWLMQVLGNEYFKRMYDLVKALWERLEEGITTDAAD